MKSIEIKRGFRTEIFHKLKNITFLTVIEPYISGLVANSSLNVPQQIRVVFIDHGEFFGLEIKSKFCEKINSKIPAMKKN